MYTQTNDKQNNIQLIKDPAMLQCCDYEVATPLDCKRGVVVNETD